MPHVPLSFIYPDDGEPSDLLKLVEKDDLIEVKWPLLDLTVLHSAPASMFGPNLADVECHTRNFRAHGFYGFSLDQYTEVLVIHEFGPVKAVVRLGDVELTLGEPTPLLRYLFDSIHWTKYHGQWGEDIQSIRLWNCPQELSEAYLLEGHAALAKHGLSLRFYYIFDFMSAVDEEDSPDFLELDLTAAVTDIEPLRFYYEGYTQSDMNTAILQFYRVLEYYSIVNLHGEIDTLRRRTDLTSREFAFKVSRIVKSNERESICRLVEILANTDTLNQAVNTNLIHQPKARSLGEKLYDFRNSIVHAKQDHQKQMFAPSIFDDPSDLVAWRHILDILSRAAIDLLGTRRI